ncbi:hypothetical protein ACHAW5_000227, partial [Stephanodiscus triporus]
NGAFDHRPPPIAPSPFPGVPVPFARRVGRPPRRLAAASAVVVAVVDEASGDATIPPGGSPPRIDHDVVVFFVASVGGRARRSRRRTERLACCGGNKRRQHRTTDDDDHAPELVSDDKTNDVVGGGGSKDLGGGSDRFFSSFRGICSDFRSQLDSVAVDPVVVVPRHGVEGTQRRTDEAGFNLEDVRSLQRHALSSSSPDRSSSRGRIARRSAIVVAAADQRRTTNMTINGAATHCAPIDSTMSDIDDILKRIDEVGDDADVRGGRGVGGQVESGTNGAQSRRGTGGGAVDDGAEEGEAWTATIAAEPGRDENAEDGREGVLSLLQPRRRAMAAGAGKHVELHRRGILRWRCRSSIGSGREEMMRYCAGPRPLRAEMLDATSTTREVRGEPASAVVSQSARHYLLRNLRDVVVLVRAPVRPCTSARPELQGLRGRADPTGAVHRIRCHSSEVRCSCYQLRVQRLDGSVKVRRLDRGGGPIIEDCSGMIFSQLLFLGEEGTGREGGYRVVRRRSRNMFMGL